MSTPARSAQLRRAVTTDVEALVDLRAVMFAAMGVAGVGGEAWRSAAGKWFRAHLRC